MASISIWQLVAAAAFIFAGTCLMGRGLINSSGFLGQRLWRQSTPSGLICFLWGLFTALVGQICRPLLRLHTGLPEMQHLKTPALSYLLAGMFVAFPAVSWLLVIGDPGAAWRPTAAVLMGLGLLAWFWSQRRLPGHLGCVLLGAGLLIWGLTVGSEAANSLNAPTFTLAGLSSSQTGVVAGILSGLLLPAMPLTATAALLGAKGGIINLQFAALWLVAFPVGAFLNALLGANKSGKREQRLRLILLFYTGGILVIAWVGSTYIWPVCQQVAAWFFTDTAFAGLALWHSLWSLLTAALCWLSPGLWQRLLPSKALLEPLAKGSGLMEQPRLAFITATRQRYEQLQDLQQQLPQTATSKSNTEDTTTVPESFALLQKAASQANLEKPLQQLWQLDGLWQRWQQQSWLLSYDSEQTSPQQQHTYEHLLAELASLAAAKGSNSASGLHQWQTLIREGQEDNDELSGQQWERLAELGRTYLRLYQTTSELASTWLPETALKQEEQEDTATPTPPSAGEQEQNQQTAATADASEAEVYESSQQPASIDESTSLPDTNEKRPNETPQTEASTNAETEQPDPAGSTAQSGTNIEEKR